MEMDVVGCMACVQGKVIDNVPELQWHPLGMLVKNFSGWRSLIESLNVAVLGCDAAPVAVTRAVAVVSKLVAVVLVVPYFSASENENDATGKVGSEERGTRLLGNGSLSL